MFTKNHFTQELENNENLKKGNFEDALRETFFKIDTLLMSKKGKKELEILKEQQTKLNNSSENSNMNRVGCTALVVLVTKTDIYIANAGDCRAMSCSFSGQIIHQTKDHKPTDPKEEARIMKAGGYINYGRVNGCLNLSRALGDLEFKENQ